MTREEFVAALQPLSKAQKTDFYLQLARALTVEGRTIWSDDTLTVEQHRERLKWLNEAMHRVLNRLADVYHDRNIWTDDDLLLILHDTVAQCPGINGHLGGAVFSALRLLKA